MKVTFNEHKCIGKIKKYFGDSYEVVNNKKDFYNIYTGMVICGDCKKEMRPLRALFHWHFNKK